MSESQWAHTIGALISVASAVLMGAELAFPIYSAVPPDWGDRLDSLEQLLPLNLYFWVVITPFGTWDDPKAAPKPAKV